MTQRSLSERVETIALSQSALPAALTLDRLEYIFSGLEEMGKTEKRRISRSVFGANSVSSCMHNFLVSQGCPSSSRVEKSFVAAAEHSDLGKMLQWFASAVVALFVDGVKSGVMFPREWEESVRRHPTLTHYAFELQGFSALFTFLLAQLAAVECVLSECGVSGEATSKRGAHCALLSSVADVAKRRRRNEDKRETGGHDANGRQPPEGAQETVAGHSVEGKGHGHHPHQDEGDDGNENTDINEMGVVVVPHAKVVKPDSGPATLKTLPRRPYVTTVNMGRVQPTWNLSETVPPSRLPDDSSPLPTIGILQSPLFTQSRQKPTLFTGSTTRPQELKTRSKVPTQEVVGRDPLLYPQNGRVDGSLLFPALCISSGSGVVGKEKNRTDCVDTGTEGLGGRDSSPNLKPVEQKTVSFSDDPAPRRRRLSETRPLSLRVEDIEQQLRSRELCKMYNVKKIVNYTERDLKGYVDDVQRLRDVVDADEDRQNAET